LFEYISALGTLSNRGTVTPVGARFYTLTIVWYSSTETYIMQRDTPSNVFWTDEEKEQLRGMKSRGKRAEIEETGTLVSCREEQ
jgi:hypothetical protein